VFENYLSASQSQANRYLQRLGHYIYYNFFQGFDRGIYYKKTKQKTSSLRLGHLLPIIYLMKYSIRLRDSIFMFPAVIVHSVLIYPFLTFAFASKLVELVTVVINYQGSIVHKINRVKQRLINALKASEITRKNVIFINQIESYLLQLSDGLLCNALSHLS
jgi:hypothetical protein